MIKFIDKSSQSYNHQEVIGDNIDEMIIELVGRIRSQSKEYYRGELAKDLVEKGESLIDIHAGNGVFYTLKLMSKNAEESS